MISGLSFFILSVIIAEVLFLPSFGCWGHSPVNRIVFQIPMKSRRTFMLCKFGSNPNLGTQTRLQKSHTGLLCFCLLLDSFDSISEIC